MEKAKNIYYVKVNVETKGWISYRDGFDWEKQKENETVTFPDKKPDGKKLRVLKYLIEAGYGDIVICHSTKLKISNKLIYMPRIVALGIINGKRHYSEKWKDYLTPIKKVIELEKPLMVENIKQNLSKAEPFKKGTNRCVITKLYPDEYLILKDLILSRNPNLKDRISQMENQ